MTLSGVVKVAPRYLRSINIERDTATRQALDGYVLTSSVQAVVDRVLSGLSRRDGHRAWTITGPYGTGKSALGLFLLRLLSTRRGGTFQSAANLLQAQCPLLFGEYLRPRP